MTTQHPTTTSRPSRRGFLAGASALAVSPWLSASLAFAQLRGRQTDGQLTPRPIAIPDLLGDDPKFGADLANVVSADLGGSGLFQPLDPRAFIDRIADINQVPRYADWKAVGAEALLVGRTTKSLDGRLGAEFRLYDTVLARQIDAKSVAIPPQNWRRLAHIVADRVYERMTQEKGYFDTQVAFIDETGPKDRRLKRLAIMDQDGFNVKLLSQGRELVLTPRFSPTQQEICFTQYELQQATSRVFVMNLDTGQRELVGNFQGQIFGPRFTPDGQRIIMSVAEAGITNLVEMDLRSKQMRRLSQGTSIDTGPCYSPDGKAIVFESDREGTQQLYVMGSGGGGGQRISRGDGRYSTPVWSPRGDYIAFTKQTGGRFLIGVIMPDGTGERILSDGFHNEGPTWAPNGRVLMFFREGQGATAGPKLFSVDLTGYNERPIPTPAFGSDPAWSPLRT